MICYTSRIAAEETKDDCIQLEHRLIKGTNGEWDHSLTNANEIPVLIFHNFGDQSVKSERTPRKIHPITLRTLNAKMTRVCSRFAGKEAERLWVIARIRD